MNTIIVTTQAELDALPKSFAEYTEIEIRSAQSTEIVVRTAYDSSTVTACGSSTVTACGSSTVRACDSSTVTACDSSTVTACGSSTVTACDSSTVTACGSSTVTACGSSTVTAYDSSTVRAYGSSTLDVLGFAVAVLWASATIRKRGKFAKVVRQKARKANTLPEWVEINAAESRGAYITLYKRVSSDLKTQERTENETTWAIGSELEVLSWAPDSQECGPGKFHACPAPFFCDEFRAATGDRYVAIKVAKKDCHVWPGAQYPHKIAFRRGTVMHECDRNGKKIEGAK